MANEVTELKLKHLEEKIAQCATRAHLDVMEDRITSELKHLKQMFKYAVILIAVILSGSGALSSDIAAQLFGAA